MQDLIADAQGHRPELAEARIDLTNREITRKAAANAMKPQVDLVAFYGAYGLAGVQKRSVRRFSAYKPPIPPCPPLPPSGYSNAFNDLFKNNSPDYAVGINVNLPLRNRGAQADQIRSQLEYRQAQLHLQQLQNQIGIEVRNAQFALVQNRSRVTAARKARDLAQQTFDIEQKKKALGASTSNLVLQADRDLAQAESNFVAAMSTYEKSRVELDRATGLTLAHTGIEIEDAVRGTVQQTPTFSGVAPRTHCARARFQDGAKLNPVQSPTAEKDRIHPRSTAMPAASHSGSRLLIADDQRDVLEALRLLLKPEGFAIETATSPAGVLDALGLREFDAVLIDLNYTRDTTSGQEGLDLLSRIQAVDSTLPVIVMTAWGSVDLAVEAMRRGARDFVQKPWENARLLSVLRTQLELGGALRRSQRLEAENRLLRAEGLPKFIANAESMQPVLRLISSIGPSDANVLVTGEHGSGKEVVARTLHALSNRASRPLVAVNTGGLPEGIFESELFGHVKGAFTDAKTDRIGRFELAHGGTLFLDEIANIPISQQAKLLRVLESGEMERVGSSQTRRVDVRIISATNADLNQEVIAGRFRQDLLVPPEYGRDPDPRAARSPPGHSSPGHLFPEPLRRALS